MARPVWSLMLPASVVYRIFESIEAQLPRHRHTSAVERGKLLGTELYIDVLTKGDPDAGLAHARNKCGAANCA
jgi:hypothetical protein